MQLIRGKGNVTLWGTLSAYEACEVGKELMIALQESSWRLKQLAECLTLTYTLSLGVSPLPAAGQAGGVREGVSELQMHLLSHAMTGRAPAQPPPRVPRKVQRPFRAVQSSSPECAGPTSCSASLTSRPCTPLSCSMALKAWLGSAILTNPYNLLSCVLEWRTTLQSKDGVREGRCASDTRIWSSRHSRPVHLTASTRPQVEKS